jgi:hypothetical protein
MLDPPILPQVSDVYSYDGINLGEKHIAVSSCPINFPDESAG